MITFKKIRWKNFLSTGNNFTEIDFKSNNNTIIIGSNGSGKSTLLDALTFVLFNKPFRKINKPQLINSSNEKDHHIYSGANSDSNIRLLANHQLENTSGNNSQPPVRRSWL